MGKITTVGIDLAKNVFSLHAVDELGATVMRKTVTRARLAGLVGQWPVCLIALEACSGAHEWARRFQAFGHTVRICKWPLDVTTADLEETATAQKRVRPTPGEPGRTRC